MNNRILTLVSGLVLLVVLIAGTPRVVAQSARDNMPPPLRIPTITPTITPKADAIINYLQSFDSPTITPSPTPTANSLGATWKTTKKEGDKWHTLQMDWTQVKGVKGYATRLSKLPGQDPGDTIKTRMSEWSFPGVGEGDWYVSLKYLNKDGSWSDIYYWNVTVPVPPAVTPVDTVVTRAPAASVLGDSDSAAATFIPDSERSQIDQLKANVERILRNLGMISFIPALEYSDRPEAELNTPKTPQTRQTTCDCTRLCAQYTSCTEAYYQLNECRCTNLDLDGNGIPCENVCTN